MKIKFMAVILTAFMMMCASACANSEKTDKPEKAESTAYSTAETQSTASTVSMPDPVPVPEGGWTYKDVIETVAVDGKTLKEGFTADDLGDGYEIRIDTQDEDECCFSLLKDDKCCYTFITHDKSEMNNLGQAKPDCLTTSYDDEDLDLQDLSRMTEKYRNCSFNGVKLGDTLDDIIEAYGQPARQGTVFITYKDKNTDNIILSFTLNDEGKINFMGLSHCQG
ncbi:MAG: hypothetical protein K6F71_02060 [Ruminococcus sp.]|uniref:hypothetical protein n=1 Tax=Ruminococcus sp. TaxID=41978 RepID=UPI0025DA7391|nr:hypothetical protein [Ruminococcus sp.]MCR5539609.1 hypothetical protein [Ruminococcus sp.]